MPSQGSLRKKHGAASRTGQACDRCKIRKIRCDARPGGCSPCLQNNSECKTTDRITGRAVQRGHTETLEQENETLRMYMLDLQQQLRDNGIEPKHPPAVMPAYVQAGAIWSMEGDQQGSWGDVATNGGMSSSGPLLERRTSSSTTLPDFRPGCIGDNYLGVSPGNELLSPIEGTRLSLFGLTLDLADFLPPSDPVEDPTSYHTFLRFAHGRAVIHERPALPAFAEFKSLADSYFRFVQPFVPILHRPDFMKLLSRVYHASYEPNLSETVILHMVMAIMLFQTALRNKEEGTKAHSIRHYHYAISFVPDLLIGHKLEHIQALTLICLQLRQQPRLGAAWSFTNTVIGIAVELGLHRSANAWQGASGERSTTITELRKRVFWSLLVLHVSIGGKLGRPMPLRIQDMDIEMPEPVSDIVPGETGISKWKRCSFRAAIPGMKLLKILMQVYATVYSVRADAEPYEITVRRLEKELEIFREQLPQELSGGVETTPEDRVPALYLQTAEEEVRLILHHPSLNRKLTPEAYEKNLDICLESSRKLRLAAAELKLYRALDTTWYYSTDYLAAIFTTLFIWTQRQDRMSGADFQQLQADMDNWLDIMGEVGFLLGSGNHLQEHLRTIIERQMMQLSKRLASKAASGSLGSSASSISPPNTHAQQIQQSPVFQSNNGFSQSLPGPSGEMTRTPSQSYLVQPPPALPQGTPSSGYPMANQYYQDSQSASGMHAYQDVRAFAPNAYNGEDIKPRFDAQHQMQSQASSGPAPQHQHPPQPVQQQSHLPPQPPPPQSAPPSFGSTFPQPQAQQQPNLQPPQYQSQPQMQPLQYPHPPQIHPGYDLSQPPPSQHGYPQQTPQQPAQPMYQEAPLSQNGFHGPSQPTQMIMYPGPAAWHNYADATMTDMPRQDHMTSATALISLSGDKPQPMPNNAPIYNMPPQQSQHYDPNTHWPMAQYGNVNGP